MSFSIENTLDCIEKSLAQKADKTDIETLYAELDKKADKADIVRLDKRIDGIENKLDQKADKIDIERLDKRIDTIENKLDQKADKTDLLPLQTEISALRTDVTILQNQMSQVIALLEKQSQTLDIIRTEQKAISATLSHHDDRIGDLEDKVFGHRVREDDPEYGKDV